MLWMMTIRWHNVFKAQTHTCALICCLHAHITTYIHCHDRLSLKEDLLRHANSSAPSSQMSEDDPGMVKTKKYRKTTQCMQLEKDLTKPRAHTHTHTLCMEARFNIMARLVSAAIQSQYNIQYTCQINLQDPQFSLLTIKTKSFDCFLVN